MADNMGVVEQSLKSSNSAAAITANCGNRSVTTALEPVSLPASDASCLWCNRTFTPRTTGGSAQRFCCTGHRQQFWIAARRWTMRAIEVGLTLGRLPKGVSHERARCLRRHSDLTDIPPIAEAYRVKSDRQCSGARKRLHAAPKRARFLTCY